MISLEEEIANAAKTLSGTSITPDDVLTFFDSGKQEIERIIEVKELTLKHAQEKYNALNAMLPDKANKPITRILEDLVKQLEVAKLEFRNEKLAKGSELVRTLKLAVCVKRHDVITETLLDLQTLRDCKKDAKIIAIEQDLQRYSLMAEADGVTYLEFYTVQEEKEYLLADITDTQYQIQALRNLI